MVRYFAYATKAAWTSDVSGVSDGVAAVALQQNERFPAPLPAEEVRWTAVSVATWTWEHYQGFNPYDHSSEAQRRRIVKRWHGNARAWTLDQVERRNRDIVQDYANGVAVTDLAEHWGISRRRVYQILSDISE